jgi:hypothetical protein
VTAQPAGSQVDYVLLALLEAGGADRFVDIEEIAVHAYRLAPTLFRWRNYAEYPSAELTRMALRHAEGRNGSLFVTGNGGRARRLNAKGLHLAQEALKRVSGGEAEPKRVERPATRGLARMLNHPAFAKWQKGGIVSVTRYDLADMLQCTPSSPALVFRDRLELSQTMAEQWERSELSAFLADAKENLEATLAGGTNQ